MDIAKSRQLAFDENTKPETLERLSESYDRLTRQYVATNPNTTVETLFKSGNEFPEEIIINPVFNLLFLENPQSTFITVKSISKVKYRTAIAYYTNPIELVGTIGNCQSIAFSPNCRINYYHRLFIILTR